MGFIFTTRRQLLASSRLDPCGATNRRVCDSAFGYAQTLPEIGDFEGDEIWIWYMHMM